MLALQLFWFLALHLTFWWGKPSVIKNLITRMNKKTRSTKSERWRHACNSVEIAWTNEQKVAVTSYGRNKNHDDEIKKNQEKANNDPSYRCAAIKKEKVKDSAKNIFHNEIWLLQLLVF